MILGASNDDGTLADARRLVRAGLGRPARSGEQTTLAIVATNAALTKTQANRIATVAHDGLARTIYPVHTPVDGDTVFAVASGTSTTPPDMMLLGALAADVVADAVLRAVTTARGLPSIPSVQDLKR